MNSDTPEKYGQPSQPGEYDDGMQALLQIMWGDGFLSPGGKDEVARLLEGSDITGCTVLDVGCGLGAIDELLITDHGAASVVGIDLDPALLAGMQRRIEAANLGKRIQTLRVHGGALPFESESFDVVFSKDSLVQIPDKSAIYAEILRILRPGGRFIASDWLRGDSGDSGDGARGGDRSGAYSPEMLEFFRLEGIAYTMTTLAQSAQALSTSGFTAVEIRDRHAWYLDLARRELDAMQGSLEPLIIQRIGAERARHFIQNWRQLVVVLERGELRPGHLKAIKSRR